MRKLYGREWHGIQFRSFTEVSSLRIADSSFYSSFYEAFFKKYKKIEEIDPAWLELKLQAAGLLKQHRKFKKESNILSIGCGLGVMEKALVEDGYTNLEITEVSKEPLKWLLPYIASDNVHIGSFPYCTVSNRRYDFIYLSGVEYLFDQDQLVDFLKVVVRHLVPGGICLVISVSFESIGINQLSYVSGRIKNLAKLIVEKSGLRKRGQFLGYARNHDDFYHAMTAAGLTKINDGVLEKKTRWDTYWIEGSKDTDII